MRFAALAAILSALLAQPAWSSQFTIDGDPEALTLVAQGATRAEVVAALAERFGMEVVGGAIADGTIEGRYTGSLGQVLALILPANGYALAYRDGKPSRVTFTGVGGTEIATGTGIPAPPPAKAVTPEPEQSTAKTEPKRLSLEARMQRDALAQVAPPAPQLTNGDAGADQKPVEQQVGQMTNEAVQQLQKLLGSIREVQPR